MIKIEAGIHEQWKQYLERGGVLNQTSFTRFQKRYLQVLADLEHHESLSDAHEACLEAGLE